MFLAFFPFSEVIYIIAGILAWLYISFGILGSHQPALNDIVSAKNVVQYQKSQLFVQEISRENNLKCYWVKGLHQSSDITIEEVKDTFRYFPFFTAFNYLPQPDITYSSRYKYIFSNRAPPSA